MKRLGIRIAPIVLLLAVRLAASAAAQESGLLGMLDFTLRSMDFPILVNEAGETCVILTMSSPDTHWAAHDNRGLILRADIDGQFANHIVVSGGAQPMEYSACLGPVPQGEHTLTLALEPDISPALAGSVHIHEIIARTILPHDIRYRFFEHAPWIYERVAEKGSDITLAIMGAPWSADGRTTIEYHIVFSNEDGGTGRNPAILMSRYGRITDIEWVYRVVLDDATGDIVSEQYQGEGHDTKYFTGRKIGRHPVLRCSTDNGNFDQNGETPVRAAPEPVIFSWGADKPRDAVMDAFPWMHRIASEEMFAENKASAKYNRSSAQLADMRDYIYIDYRAKNLNGEKTLSFEVKLKNEKRWLSSNPGKDVPFLGDDGLLAFSGWARTNIKLPPGVKYEDIEAFRIAGSDKVAYEIHEVKAFMLDPGYAPLPPFFTLSQPATLSQTNRTATFKIERQSGQ